jgi:hypothetical protein
MDSQDKKKLSETDICDLFITPDTRVKGCRMGSVATDQA